MKQYCKTFGQSNDEYGNWIYGEQNWILAYLLDGICVIKLCKPCLDLPAAKNSTDLNIKKTILISVCTVVEIMLMVVHFKGKVWYAVVSIIDLAQKNNFKHALDLKNCLLNEGLVWLVHEMRVSEAQGRCSYKTVTLQDSNRHLSAYTCSCSRNTHLFTVGSACTRRARLRSCAAIQRHT